MLIQETALISWSLSIAATRSYAACGIGEWPNPFQQSGLNICGDGDILDNRREFDERPVGGRISAIDLGPTFGPDLVHDARLSSGRQKKQQSAGE